MENTIQTYRDLIVWQKSMELVVLVYEFTESFPPREMYGLASQLRRAAVSIPSNIAEGRRRGSRKDYAQFLRIAYGSGAEVETQLEIAKRLRYDKEYSLERLESLLTELMKMLNAMLASLQATS